MTTQPTEADRAALLAPVERHRIVTHTRDCDTCGGLGRIHLHEGWVPCLPCGGWGFVSDEYREALS